MRGKGEGSIRKKREGLWEARYSAGYDSNGKMIRKSVYGKTRKEVQSKLQTLIGEHNLGKVVDGDTQKFYDWSLSCFEDYKKPKLKPASIEVYDILLKNHLKGSSIDIPLKNLNNKLLQKYLNEKAKSYSDQTIHRLKTFIKWSLNKAVENKVLIFNPVQGIETPKGSTANLRGFSYFTEDEHRQLIKYVLEEEDDLRLRAIVILTISTGLRIGEVLGLLEDDLDTKKGIVHVNGNLRRVKTEEGYELIHQTPKTLNSYREIPLMPYCISVIKDWQIQKKKNKFIAGKLYLESDYVFSTDLGKPLDPRNMNRSFQRMLSRAGMRIISFHGLRHSFATRLLELGENPKTASELLGHNVATLLQRYSHVTLDTKKKSVEKLEKILL